MACYPGGDRYRRYEHGWSWKAVGLDDDSVSVRNPRMDGNVRYSQESTHDRHTSAT
jgi:hypothetical protein